MEDIRPIENKNFIDNFIEEDLAAGGRFEGKRSTPGSRRSRTDTCISATARP